MNYGKRRAGRTKIMRLAPRAGLTLALLATLSEPALAGKKVNCPANLQSELDAIKPGGELVITGTCVGNFVAYKSVVIRGKGTAPTLFGAGKGTVLTVMGAANKVKIKNMTITGGGNVNDGAGILNYSILTLVDSVVTGNNAFNNGGGIYNFGTTTLKQSWVTGNHAGLDGAGVYNNSSAAGWGSLSLYGSEVTGNKAGGGGGGIYTFGSTYLQNAVLNGNQAGGDGGGLKSAPASITTITGSVITGNIAADNGGVSGTVTFHGKKSTISGNLPDSP